ncbi:AEC family transporter [Actibacterium sp. XHP0104]|uniref:AEC family transporter n=1 Tax=Actibacterium sp. XHP0104 TaxID=2984335 RepID=UPI0021E7CF5B|nr:AEC family transporter [Actibacterium sp. XHP0104]MCV2882765.1 AEC family transporter [Actibacterium sp. XHP0104]
MMFQTIAPIFVLVAVGFAAVRTGYVGADTIRPLGAFVVRVALPALIIRSIGGLPFGQAVQPGFVLAYAGASLAVMLLALIVTRRVLRGGMSEAAMAGLGAATSNTGFMGYPIGSMVLGPALGAQLMAQCMIVEIMLIIPLAMVISDVARGGRGRVVGQVLASLLRNPILAALAVALLISGSGATVPPMLDRVLGLLAGVSAPLALFVIGGTLAALPFQGLADRLGVILLGKLVLHPLLAMGALALVPGLDPQMRAGGVLFAAMPMFTIYPIFGQRAGVEMMTASALVAATALSFVTLSVWMALIFP